MVDTTAQHFFASPTGLGCGSTPPPPGRQPRSALETPPASLGLLATDATSEAFGDRAAALAAGGLLAMLTNSLMPFAFERAKELAGVATVVGFCLTMLNT